MKVLWHINLEIPLGDKNIVNEGWIGALAKELSSLEEIQLYLLFPQNRQSKLLCGQIDGCKYIGYYNNQITKYNPHLANRLAGIIKKINPDIVHIMGTEYPHSYSVYEACEQIGIQNNVVTSIQGVISECAKHIDDFVPNRIKNSKTLYDYYKKNMSLCEMKDNFTERGRYEKALLSKVNHIIGRTDWDKAFVNRHNDKANYYYNQEVMRQVFYDNVWNLQKCRRHSIFISQASYALKGFHIFLKGLKVIVNKYPDTHVFVAGHSQLFYSDSRFKLGRYDRYCFDLMGRYKLFDNVDFVGPLNEEQMLKMYLSANVFVCSSTIENSSNSIGEAMLLGVPVVTSYVGGISSLVKDKIDALCFENGDYTHMAKQIMKIFAADDLACGLSGEARERALELHDKKVIKAGLLEIYNNILM